VGIRGLFSPTTDVVSWPPERKAGPCAQPVSDRAGLMSESNLDLNRCFYAFVMQICLLLAAAFCLWLGTAIKESARTPEAWCIPAEEVPPSGKGWFEKTRTRWRRLPLADLFRSPPPR
jgi:hypothetical protein